MYFIDPIGFKMNDNIKKASRHISQNEGLIFEQSSPGKRAFDLPPLDVPAVDPAKALGDHHREQRHRRISRSQRNRSSSPLHSPFHLELRHRSRHVSAGFLHHEIQSARKRICRAPRRHRHRTSLSATGTFAGLPENSASCSKSACLKSPAWTPSPCSPPRAHRAN